MYKYKKTIIINNRRRRIFSKEKSNTEYILYKKEYITLNAYNKKTGGGLRDLVTSIFNKTKSETNEFEILKNDDMLKKLNYEIYMYDDNSKIISWYLNSNNGVLYKYYKNNSTLISEYLKSKQKIASNTDKKYWIITKETDINITVHGYTMDEWIIQYSKYKNNYYFTRYCKINNITLNNSNIEGMYWTFIHIYQRSPSIFSDPKHTNLYFLDDIGSCSNETKKVYIKLQNQLSKNSKTFYIMTDLDESQKDLYEINNYYELFKGCFFKCISKPLLSDKYDISFIYLNSTITVDKFKKIFK
jgi:hypothetical protein